MTQEQMMQNKEEYKRLLLSTNRQGVENLINWLETSDFFIAPSSSVYHSNYPGGLCEHSLNVYKAMKSMKEGLVNLVIPEKSLMNIPEESLIIVALLHDLCKVNFYKETIKFFKDDNSTAWKKYKTYEIDDKMPLGHGEKSLVIAQCFISLKAEEMLAIRWHMGMTDPGAFLSSNEKYALMRSLDYPLVILAAEADMFASYMMEYIIDQKKELVIQ